MSSPRFKMALPFLHEANWMRQTARFVLAGWLLPVFFALFAALQTAPAQAQTPVQTVVVLDFAVANGLDPLLGRKAADGLAVELQRSGDFEVVPRARVEEAVAQQAGLQPPFNDTAQIRLAQALNARSVFSGRIVAVSINPGKSATVNVEVRQLDAATGDYLNGTQVIEPAEQRLSAVANEILIDEALNKAVFSAVRSMRQTTLPVGAVLNTTRDDVELSIGARNGVAVGQRYSVLRDVYNRAKNVTTREKIAEVTITRVENDQSTARVSAGGAGGVRTGDRIRQIFVPGTYPVSIANSNGGSITPVTAPPTSRGGESFAKKSSKGLLGLVGLAALVGLAGFGGGSGSGGTPSAGEPREANPSGEYPTATFTFRPGFTGINFSQTLQREAAVAYLIYRSENPGFLPEVTNLQAVIDARLLSSSDRISFTDVALNPSGDDLIARRRVTIGENNDNADNNDNNGSISFSVESAPDDGPDSFLQTNNQIEIEYTQRPLFLGTTYYYRVARISAERVRVTNDNDDDNNNDNNDTDFRVDLRPTISPVSDATGGYTALFRPVIQNNQTEFDTDNLTLSINADFNQFLTTNAIVAKYQVPLDANVGSGADEFRFEVSTDSSFAPERTFRSQTFPNPGGSPQGDLTFQLGDIRVPSSSSNPYEPGVTPLYIRALIRNSQDAVPTFRIGRTFTVPLNQVAGTDSISSSRFMAAPASTRGGGVSIGRGGSGVSGASSGTYTTPRVLKPR